MKVPDESIAAYKTATVWKEFQKIVTLSGDPDKCATPTIALQNGKIVVITATEGAECNTSITTDDVQSTKANEISLSGIYTITTYATKKGLLNSETATAVLVWTNPSIGEDLETQVLSMDTRKTLLLRSDGNHIVVCGTETDELLELYSINGIALDKAKADGNDPRLGNALQKGQTYIIKVGDRSVKYRF